MDVLTALYWLSLNCYHEARSEPPLGQAYVSKTVMNRAEKSGKSIKATILSPKQFSWVGTEIGQRPIYWFASRRMHCRLEHVQIWSRLYRANLYSSRSSHK